MVLGRSGDRVIVRSKSAFGFPGTLGVLIISDLTSPDHSMTRSPDSFQSRTTSRPDAEPTILTIFF